MGALGAIWGALGVTVVLAGPVARLAHYCLELRDLPLEPIHWLLLVGNVGFMAYSEGYKGFQLAFSPRVAARTRALYDQPTLARVLLAPLFCMAFFGSTPRRTRVTWILAGVIVGVVFIVRALPQPWRGILDAGVVVGLSWGVLAYWVFLARAFSARGLDVDPELPG